ncbi:MAG: hypothetical protein WAZ77_21405 [Candidatus Nitrosopolaris sp.]
MTIKTKCVYDKPDPGDGCRILIMTPNPTFDTKNFDSWVTELSPSPELLKSLSNWDD